MTTIDGLKQNNAYVVQTSGTGHTNSVNGSQTLPIVTNGQVTECASYTMSDIKKEELSNIEKLYKKLSDTFVEWGITVEEAKNAGVIEKVAGKSTEQLNENDLTRVEESIKRAAAFVKSQKGELNLENLMNAANKINVAAIGGQYSWETVDAEIDKMQKGQRSSLFQHEDLNDFMERYYGVDFDNMTLEQVQTKATKLGIKLSDNADLETAKKELKAGMLDKYFANHEFNSPAQQLDDFTKMLINTKDPEERKMFVEGVKSLYAENKEPAIQKLLASFTEIADRMDAADKLGQELAEITQDTMPEQTESIARTITTEQSEEGAKETAETLNTTLEQIAEIMEKQINGVELNDDEKALLEKFEQYKALNKGKDQGYLVNNNLSDDTRIEILHNSLKTYSDINQKIRMNLTEEMLDSLTAYVEEHPEISITHEQLSDIIKKAEYYIGTPKIDIKSDNEADTQKDTVVVADATQTKEHGAYEQKVDKEEIKAAEERRNEIKNKVSSTEHSELPVVTARTTIGEAQSMGMTRELLLKNKFGFLKQVFCSNSEANNESTQIALNAYDNMNTVTQSDVLGHATSKFFLKLFQRSNNDTLKETAENGTLIYDRQKKIENSITY